MLQSQRIFPVSERKNFDQIELDSVQFSYGEVQGHLFRVSLNSYLKAISALESAENEIIQLKGVIGKVSQ